VRLRRFDQRSQVPRTLSHGLDVPVVLESDPNALSPKVADPTVITSVLAGLLLTGTIGNHQHSGWGHQRAERPWVGWSGVVRRRGQVLAGQGEEGAPGWQAGGGLPHQQQAAVERGAGEAQPDQLVVTF
jgi:hypothetical protein